MAVSSGVAVAAVAAGVTAGSGGAGVESGADGPAAGTVYKHKTLIIIH